MIIIDTHVFVWEILEKSKISTSALKALDYHESEQELFICDISFWEIGMLVGKEKIKLNTTVENFINQGLHLRNYQILSINGHISQIVSEFANEINSDPADRIITSTALSNKASLVTADKNLRKVKGLKVIW